jgi:hypothetical protein
MSDDDSLESADAFPDRLTIFGFGPSVAPGLAGLLRSTYAPFLPGDGDDPLGAALARPAGAANWVVLRVSDASAFPAELTVGGARLILMAGDFGSSAWSPPPAPPPAPPRRAAAPPPVFRLPPHDQDPRNDDWATIPFERKNAWAKVREFVLGQRVVRASSFPISGAFGPAFWALALLLLVFVCAEIRLWVAGFFVNK